MIKYRNICLALLALLFITGIRYSFAYDKKVKIAIIKTQKISAYDKVLNVFLKVLKAKGYGIQINSYDMKGSIKEGKRIINIIKSKRPDLILTLGTEATKVAKKNIKDKPILFSMVLEPVDCGLVKSFKSSGNNLTGVSISIPIETQFKTLKLIVPYIKRVGIIYSPRKSETKIKQAKKIATKMGLKLVTQPVNTFQDVPYALKKIRPKVDALWSIPDCDIMTIKSARCMVDYSFRNKMPFMGLSSYFVKAGALLALSCDYNDIGRQSAELAIKILKGQNPSYIPIVRPRKSLLYINLNTAKNLGISIPSHIQRKAKIFK